MLEAIVELCAAASAADEAGEHEEAQGLLFQIRELTDQELFRQAKRQELLEGYIN